MENKKGQYDDAIRVYKSIFGIITAIYGEEEYTPPLHILAWLHGNIADCYLKLGDTESAYSWFEKMIEHHKTNGKYYKNAIEHSVAKLRIKLRSRAKKISETKRFGILKSQIYEQDDFFKEILGRIQ